MDPSSIRVEGPGGAPFLVLANSLGSTADMWEPQMGPLSDRFRVVRFEHRGHGGTPAPEGPYTTEQIGGDLLEVLDVVGAARASVVGLSLGGSAGLWLAAHHPERVERLVVACGRAHWPPPDVWHERSQMVLGSGTEALLEVLLPRWFTPEFLATRPEIRPWVAAMLASASPEGYAGCCGALATMDLRPDLGSVAAPTLVLAGATDPAVPVAAAAELASSIPGASLQVIAPGAHLLNVEQPARFTSAVLDHLCGTSLERGRAMRRAVLGDDHVERSERAVTRLTAPFSEYLTRSAWGEVWTRPGLDRRTRSAITVAMLVAVGRFDELELHLRGARRNGLTDREIGEVLLQSSIYCGVPAANTAFAVARRVLEGLDGG